jgi:cytochrome P450
MSARPNLLLPELKANPYPLYAELRRNSPVCQVDPGGMWAVTRHEDALFVFKNPQLFSSEGFRQAMKPAWLGSNPFADSVLTMDPPRHGPLRALLARAFTGSMVARMEARVRAFAEQVVAELPLGQPVDMVPHFSLRVPAFIVGGMLGLDPSLNPRLKYWADQLTSVTAIRAEDTARQQEVRQAVADLQHHLAEVVARRRREPADDMVSELLSAQVEGETLPDDVLMATLFLLLVGGLETTVNMLSYSVLNLRDRPEVLARLRADPSLIPRFTEEVGRYECPAQGLVRMTTQEVEVGGVRIPKGEKVLILMASAGRDERQFPDGERFDIERPGPQNLPFGHGIHFCLGAQLARMELRVALEALLKRCARISATEEPVKWHRSVLTRGIVSLQVVLHGT